VSKLSANIMGLGNSLLLLGSPFFAKMDSHGSAALLTTGSIHWGWLKDTNMPCPPINGKKITTDFSTNPVNLQYDARISYSQNIPLLLEGGLGPQSTKAYRAAHGEQRNSTHSTGTLSGRQLEEASREILRFRSRFHGSNHQT
jgi:hypothetical protein